MKLRNLKRAYDDAGRADDRRAYIAHINWYADLQHRLMRVASLFAESKGFPKSYFVSRIPLRSYRFQINAVPARLIRPIDDSNEPWTAMPVHEEPAALVFSMHPCGSVSVLISPHRSEWSAWERKSYVVAHYLSPYELAGPVGDKRIAGHIGLFLQVAQRSSVVGFADDFAEKLGKMHDRYERLYENRTAARRARADAEIGLGVGLVGGLIASTILPFAQSFGADSRESVQRIRNECSLRVTPEHLHACEVAHATYKADSVAGWVLTTGHLISVALVISLVSILIVRSTIKGR